MAQSDILAYNEKLQGGASSLLQTDALHRRIEIMIRTVVIAGTPVDTMMGVEYLRKRSDEYCMPVCDPIYRPAAGDCDEQIKFQYSDTANKKKVIDGIFDPAIADGVEDFFIYCNSLSGAFDFESYAQEKSEETGRPVRVFTPLQVYRRLAGQYSRVAVVAANNLSAYKIEETFMDVNPDIYVIGSGNMDIVSSIERGLSPEEIVERCGIRHLVEYMTACRCEALVLGCTHFPYLRKEIDKFCTMPVIDPADEMFSAMTGLR